MPRSPSVKLGYELTVKSDILLTQPKLQKEVHQAPSTTSHAAKPPSGTSSWNVDFSRCSSTGKVTSLPLVVSLPRVGYAMLFDLVAVAGKSVCDWVGDVDLFIAWRLVSRLSTSGQDRRKPTQE